MSNKVKMAPELSPNNQKPEEQVKEPKLKWSEKHPKAAAFFKSLPGKALNAGKKILTGIVVVGGGIILGVIGLQAAKPRRYGEFTIQLPETPRPLLPKVDEPVAAPTMTFEEAGNTLIEAAKADPNVEVTEF